MGVMQIATSTCSYLYTSIQIDSGIPWKLCKPLVNSRSRFIMTHVFYGIDSSTLRPKRILSSIKKTFAVFSIIHFLFLKFSTKISIHKSIIEFINIRGLNPKFYVIDLTAKFNQWFVVHPDINRTTKVIWNLYHFSYFLHESSIITWLPWQPYNKYLQLSYRLMQTICLGWYQSRVNVGHIKLISINLAFREAVT